MIMKTLKEMFLIDNEPKLDKYPKSQKPHSDFIKALRNGEIREKNNGTWVTIKAIKGNHNGKVRMGWVIMVEPVIENTWETYHELSHTLSLEETRHIVLQGMQDAISRENNQTRIIKEIKQKHENVSDSYVVEYFRHILMPSLTEDPMINGGPVSTEIDTGWREIHRIGAEVSVEDDSGNWTVKYNNSTFTVSGQASVLEIYEKLQMMNPIKSGFFTEV